MNPYRGVELLAENLQGWFLNEAPIRKLIQTHNVKTVVEIGSWKGLSTSHIAKMLPAKGKVYAVDSWIGFPSQYYSKYDTSTIYQQFLSNMIHQNLTDIVVPIRLESLEAAKTCVVSPDLIYLDANHEYDAVYADLTAWFPFVKERGILCGDDWGWTWPGLSGFPVAEAVARFAKESQLPLETDGWFWKLHATANNQIPT